jgi:hypothetical protein
MKRDLKFSRGALKGRGLGERSTVYEVNESSQIMLVDLSIGKEVFNFSKDFSSFLYIFS